MENILNYHNGYFKANLIDKSILYYFLAAVSGLRSKLYLSIIKKLNQQNKKILVRPNLFTLPELYNDSRYFNHNNIEYTRAFAK